MGNNFVTCDMCSTRQECRGSQRCADGKGTPSNPKGNGYLIQLIETNKAPAATQSILHPCTCGGVDGVLSGGGHRFSCPSIQNALRRKSDYRELEDLTDLQEESNNGNSS